MWQGQQTQQMQMKQQKEAEEKDRLLDELCGVPASQKGCDRVFDLVERFKLLPADSEKCKESASIFEEDNEHNVENPMTVNCARRKRINTSGP